jgi:hypothetical protein
MHRDAEKLFDESNRNQSAFFGNLNFSFPLYRKFDLSFRGGLQFRQIHSKQDVQYEYKDVPFKDADGVILFYISRPPVSMPLKGSSDLYFLQLPLSLTYTLPLNSKYECLISGGVNLSTLMGARGQAYDINQSQITKVKNMIKNKPDMGPVIGLELSRLIYGNWWLGLEAGYQSNKATYDLGPGILQSRMQAFNIQLNMRYKFLK